MAIFRTRFAMNSSTRPGFSFALTPVLTKDQTTDRPQRDGQSKEQQKRLQGQVSYVPFSLRLLHERRKGSQEFFAGGCPELNW